MGLFDGSGFFYGYGAGQDIRAQINSFKDPENYKQTAKDFGKIAATTATIYFPMSRTAGLAGGALAKGAQQCKKIVNKIGKKNLCAGVLAMFCKDPKGFDAGGDILKALKTNPSITRNINIENRSRPFIIKIKK